jgi:hypothetical protein
VTSEELAAEGNLGRIFQPDFGLRLLIFRRYALTTVAKVEQAAFMFGTVGPAHAFFRA